MPKNKNTFRFISAFARGLWLMDAESAHSLYPDFLTYMNGGAEFSAEDIPEDDIIEPTPDEDDYSDEEPNTTADDFTGKIAIVSITGPIMHYGGPCSYGATDYAARLRAYADDATISAGILKGNTPGGQVDGTQTWADAVNYFRTKKPLLGFIDDGRIGSAGVWGFSGCSEIYASHETCEIGSVGVMSRILDIRKALEIGGIKEILTYAPQSTDKNKTYDDALNGDDKALTAELRFICDKFINAVSTGRGAKLTTDIWQTGSMYYAAQAKKIGLIDGIMPFDKVVKRAMYLATQNNQANSKNQNMSLFGTKFKKLNALTGKKAAEISDAEIVAVNEELKAEGVENVVVITSTHLLEADTNADAVSSALATINTVLGAGNEKTTLADALTEFTTAATKTATDRDAWKVKAEAYGDQPGVLPTKPQAAGEKPEGGDQLPPVDNTSKFKTSYDVELEERNKKSQKI